MSGSYQFAEWFMRATGHEPYPFQIRFADGDWLRNAVPVPGHTRLEEGEGRGKGGLRGEGLLVDVPPGLGKTAMAVLGRL